jgi:hypothetical protein
LLLFFEDFTGGVRAPPECISIDSGKPVHEVQDPSLTKVLQMIIEKKRGVKPGGRERGNTTPTTFSYQLNLLT